MYAKRIIPCLDVKNGRVVKGVSFVNLRDAGDPVECAVEYDKKGADELVLLDITATHEGRGTMIDIVTRVADSIFIPFTVGGGIHTTDDFKELLRGFRPKMLLIPLATIGGTLLFSALVSVLLTRWSVFDCLAVGSGRGYYSLSSILIMELKTPDLGAQLATELATIALLTNVIRELVALVGAPFICKYFGKLAPISVAGVTSVDVALPSIIRVSGKEMVPLAIFHGLLVDMSVPFFISLFCKL